MSSVGGGERFSVIKCEGKKNHSAVLNFNRSVQPEWSVIPHTRMHDHSYLREREREIMKYEEMKPHTETNVKLFYRQSSGESPKTVQEHVWVIFHPEN